MAQRCQDFQRDSDLWNDCNNYEYELSRVSGHHLNCSDEMFVEKRDPNDSSAGANRWYVDVDKFVECYNKASSELEFLGSNTCKKVRVNSPNWEKCEATQTRLWRALGCDDRMFNRNGDYFDREENKLGNCKDRLNTVGNLTLKKPDGSSTEPVSRLAAQSPGGASGSNSEEGQTQPDCEVTGAILSWIACPIIDMGVNFTDFVFEEFVQPLLANVPITAEPGDGSYEAWKQFRLLGNILLIGTLLAIVYSQTRGGK